MRTAAVLAATGLALAGCGAGQQAATSEQVSATYGAGGQAGDIGVRNAQFVYDRPVPGGVVYAPGTSAPLRVSIVNTGALPDRLVAVESPVATVISVTGPTALPGGQVLTAGYEDPLASVPTPGTQQIEIAFTGLTTPLRAGLTYPVTFVFERAGDLLVEVPIAYPDDVPAPRAGEEPPEAENVLETGPEVPVVPPR
jgi:copper(I)-binding protein